MWQSDVNEDTHFETQATGAYSGYEALPLCFNCSEQHHCQAENLIKP
jgi:hypothetical protein